MSSKRAAAEESFRGYADGRSHLKRRARNPTYSKYYDLGVIVVDPVVAAPKGEDYFGQVLELLTRRILPFEVPSLGTTGMVDQDLQILQDWCAYYAQPTWATGLSMIEAAELIVKGAIDNGNIRK
jgi:hypothetical protein